MSETAAWIYLREQFAEAGVFSQKTSDRLTAGLPDIYWCLEGSGWLELKWLATWDHRKQIGMRPGQAPWLWKHARAGGNSGILVRVGNDRWHLFKPTADVSWIARIEGSFHPSELPGLHLECGLDIAALLTFARHG